MENVLRIALTVVLFSMTLPCSAQDKKPVKSGYPIHIKWVAQPTGPVAPWEVPVIKYQKTSPIVQNVSKVLIIEKLTFTDLEGKVKELTATDHDVSIPGTSGTIKNDATKMFMEKMQWDQTGLYGAGVVKRAIFDPSKKLGDPSAQLSNWLPLSVIRKK